MKKITIYLFAAIIISSFSMTSASAEEKVDFKAGDKVYVCNCDPDCGCGTVSKKPGKCPCGMDLAEAKVKKTVVLVDINGKEKEITVSDKATVSVSK